MSTENALGTPEQTFKASRSFPTELKGNSAEGNPLGEVGQGSHAGLMRDREGAKDGIIPPFQR